MEQLLTIFIMHIYELRLHFYHFLHTLCIDNSLSNSVIIFQLLKCYDTDQCYAILPVCILKIKIVIITSKMLRFITPLDLLANTHIISFKVFFI